MWTYIYGFIKKKKEAEATRSGFFTPGKILVNQQT
jgi:hypothetical protein